MSKFKLGDEVKYVGKQVMGYDRGIGEIIKVDNSAYPNAVRFNNNNPNIGAYSDASLELISELTTLEKLAEYQKSGEEFMINNHGAIYKFDLGRIESNNVACEFRLNYILDFGIKEMPWKPKEDEIFWFIDNRGEIYQTHNNGSKWAKELLESGNYFRTKELAEAVGIKKILKEANHG